MKDYYLVCFDRDSGEIDVFLEAKGKALLNLWALQNTTESKDTIVFEKETGMVDTYYTGTKDFPEVEKSAGNIEDYCPGFLAAMQEPEKGMDLSDFLAYFDFNYDVILPDQEAERNLRAELVEDGVLSEADINKPLLCLIDLQGANLGDIHLCRYPIEPASVEKIIDRMDIYVEEFKKEYRDALDSRDMDPTKMTFKEMYETCKRLGVGEDEVNYSFGSAYLNADKIFIKECSFEYKIAAVKEEYSQEGIVMSELLRNHDELSVAEKRELLSWAGDSEYVEVLDDGTIEPIHTEKKPSVDHLLEDVRKSVEPGTRQPNTKDNEPER